MSCKISSRVYFDELFRVVCQEGELIFQRVKGIFKFEMWFIDRRESVSLCLPGCSSLKFDVLWQGYTSFDDTRFSIPRFIFLLHCYLPSVFFEEKLEFWKKTCSVWKIQIQKYRENIRILISKQENNKLMEKYSWKNLSRHELDKYFLGRDLSKFLTFPWNLYEIIFLCKMYTEQHRDNVALNKIFDLIQNGFD